MLVASSFDLWKKDAFFSAAEEVQDSADILDSAYRLWLKVKRDGGPIQVVDELHRELKTALGTAKWQLEEFERAIRLSYGSCRDEDKAARHQQFVVAMETQITCVENELTKSLHEQGKEPLRWVNLDDDEKDDLAMFLSGTQGDGNFESINASICSESENLKGSSKDEFAIDMDSGFTNESSIKEVHVTRDELCSPVDGMVSTRRTRTLPNFGSMQIVIPDDDERWGTSATCIEATPKVKGSRILNLFPIRATNWINQITLGSNIFGRRLQSPWSLHTSQSVRRLVIALLLILFFVVSLAFYSA